MLSGMRIRPRKPWTARGPIHSCGAPCWER